MKSSYNELNHETIFKNTKTTIKTKETEVKILGIDIFAVCAQNVALRADISVGQCSYESSPDE
jgi:hypothetical protein